MGCLVLTRSNWLELTSRLDGASPLLRESGQSRGQQRAANSSCSVIGHGDGDGDGATHRPAFSLPFDSMLSTLRHLSACRLRDIDLDNHRLEDCDRPTAMVDRSRQHQILALHNLNNQKHFLMMYLSCLAFTTLTNFFYLHYTEF